MRALFALHIKRCKRGILASVYSANTDGMHNIFIFINRNREMLISREKQPNRISHTKIEGHEEKK